MFLFISFSTFAFDKSESCELTNEYKEARKNIYFAVKKIHDSYNQCRSAIQSAYYWEAVAACAKEGLGKNIGGGCGHLVSNGDYPMEQADKSHCDIFKVSREVEKKYKQELFNQLTVAKCKT